MVRQASFGSGEGRSGEGLSEVSYVGRQPHYVSKFFVATDENSAYARIFVPQVIVDGDPYRLTYANTVHYPFGYTSECTVGDVKFEHAMVLDNNVILRRIRVVENPKGRKVRARIVQMDNLMRNRGGNRRQWTTHGLDIDRTNGVIRGSLEYHHRGSDGVVPVEIGAMNPVAFPINSLPERVFRGNHLAIRVRGRGTDCRYTLNGAPVELKDGVLPWDRFASGDNELAIDVR